MLVLFLFIYSSVTSISFLFALGGKVSDRLTKSVDLLLIGGAKEGKHYYIVSKCISWHI